MGKPTPPAAPSLFDNNQSANEPLAARMRPRTLDEFAGQEHIVGPGRLLRRAIQADRLSSVIFAGPPGTGKTTLARIIAQSTARNFQALNAVLAGVADIRQAIATAQQQRSLYNRQTILFIDEVHRWNKAQQDALLPWVENGTFILIGATTENPFFEVNAAIVSRSRIFMLRPLTKSDLSKIANQAIADPNRGYGRYRVRLETGTLEHLIDTCGGDARTLLNALELAIETTPAQWPPDDLQAEIVISQAVAEESIQKRVVLYDKEGDYHFDTISAFIKSLRGSDPDASLYWLARMIAGGEEPRYIFRRLLIAAGEDVGLADPQALVVVQAAAAAFDRVGMPEGQFFLAQASLYLATAPKSNSTMGFFDALAAQTVHDPRSTQVPLHLRDSSRDGPAMGHGQAYLYPHAYKDHWVAQTYLPQFLQDQSYYQPSNQGYEAGLVRLVADRKWEQLSVAATMVDEPFSFGPPDQRLNLFIKRQQKLRTEAQQLAADGLALLRCPRHGRLGLDGNGLIGWLPWALAAVPEGQVIVLTNDSETLSLTNFIQTNLPIELEGVWIVRSWQAAAGNQDQTFVEFGLSAAFTADQTTWADQFQRLRNQSRPETIWLLRLADVLAGSRLSSVIPLPEIQNRLRQIEDVWLTSGDAQPPAVDFTTLTTIAETAGFRLLSSHPAKIVGQLLLDPNRLERWTNPNATSLAAAIHASLSSQDWAAYCKSLADQQGANLPWQQQFRWLRFSLDS